MNTHGQHMRAEIADASDVFVRSYRTAISTPNGAALEQLNLGGARAFTPSRAALRMLWQVS
jgi:hypothetical protein